MIKRAICEDCNRAYLVGEFLKVDVGEGYKAFRCYNCMPEYIERQTLTSHIGKKEFANLREADESIEHYEKREPTDYC